MKNPCRKDCPRRRAGTKDRPSCHASCKEYMVFWDENRRRGEEALKESIAEGLKIDGLQRAEKARRLVKGKLYSKRR